MVSPDLEFENYDGEMTITDYDDEVCITCQTNGSYDYGSYYLKKSEVDQVIDFLQNWKKKK